MNKGKSKIENDSIILCDGSGVVVKATYDAELLDTQIEEGHGKHETGNIWMIDVKSVTVIIAGKSLSMLNMLTPDQQSAIRFQIIESLNEPEPELEPVLV